LSEVERRNEFIGGESSRRAKRSKPEKPDVWAAGVAAPGEMLQAIRLAVGFIVGNALVLTVKSLVRLSCSAEVGREPVQLK